MSEKKHPGGRPTKYKEEYCKTVIEFMAKGASKVEFCAHINVVYDTFLDWQKKHPEFSESVKVAEKKSQAWWEEKGRDAAFGKVEGFNATAFIFMMKNRFKDDYTDRKEVVNDHKSSDGSMTPKAQLTPEQEAILNKALDDEY